MKRVKPKMTSSNALKCVVSFDGTTDGETLHRKALRGGHRDNFS
jgi:hypothetical protein